MTIPSELSSLSDRAAWDTWDTKGGASIGGPQALDHATPPVSEREPTSIGHDTELLSPVPSATDEIEYLAPTKLLSEEIFHREAVTFVDRRSEILKTLALRKRIQLAELLKRDISATKSINSKFRKR